MTICAALDIPADAWITLNMSLMEQVRHTARELADSEPDDLRIFWRLNCCDALHAMEVYCGRRAYLHAVTGVRRILNQQEERRIAT